MLINLIILNNNKGINTLKKVPIKLNKEKFIIPNLIKYVLIIPFIG